jgi:hypothetical protein
MPNTSATGGYLTPDGVIAPPLEDDALDDFLGDVVAAIVGLDRDTRVRPRWQLDPPNPPARNVDWAAVGVPNRPRRDTFPVIQHDGAAAAGAGADILIRNEDIELLVTFYGPHCQANATLLADGIFVAQNREALATAGIKLVSAGEPTKAPELLKGLWYPRCDLAIVLRREVRREYPVLNLLSAAGEIVSTAATVAFNANP